MYLLYVDESGDPGENGSDYLILGCCVIFEGKWQYIEQEIEKVKAHYFSECTPPDEIHLTDLRSGKNEFRALHKSKRLQLVADLCAIANELSSSELAFFSVIAEKGWWFRENPGKSGDDLYVDMFEDITSRFDLYLRRQHAYGYTNKGMIIADPHKQRLTKMLKMNQKLFQSSGTRWSKLYNLIETIFFLDSRDSPGLQLADLCSFGVWRLITANDDMFIRSIRTKFDREPRTSDLNPGKWHGIKFIGTAPDIQERLDAHWPANQHI